MESDCADVTSRQASLKPTRYKMGMSELAAVIAVALVIGGSIVYGATALSSEMELSRLQQKATDEALQSEMVLSRLQQETAGEILQDAVRIARIQSLAADCAAVAVKDIENVNQLDIRTDQSVIWLALTGDRDPDDALGFTDSKITDAIVRDCYRGFYWNPKYDDVREYMRER